MDVEGRYGGNLVKLDINKVLLSKDMEVKDRRIRELTLYQVCAGGLKQLLFQINVFCISSGRNRKRSRSE